MSPEEPLLPRSSKGDCSKGWGRRRFKWKSLIPVHVLIFALAVSLSQPLQLCAQEVAELLSKSSQQAEVCMEQHRIQFDSLENFRVTRKEWHTGFDNLLSDVARDYKGLVLEENYDGHCQSRYPVVIFLANSAFLFALVCSFGYFIFQDATTSFGASRTDIFIAANILGVMSVILGVFTYPALHTLHVAVKLSVELNGCVTKLKALQRKVIRKHMDLDLFNLHASAWDGVEFGVRDPLLNMVVNKEFEEWIFRRIYFLILICLVISIYLFYRSNVKSLVQWRKAIPSVVCIGVTFPGSKEPNKLWRLGSGCIVSSQRGLILTNWHLFQRLGVADDEHRPGAQSDMFDTWSVGSGRVDSPTVFSTSVEGSVHSPWRQGAGGMDPPPGTLWRQSSNEDEQETMKKSLQSLRYSDDMTFEETTPTRRGPQAQNLSDFEPEDDLAASLAADLDEFGIPLDEQHGINHTTSAPAMMQHQSSSVQQHRHLANFSQYAESLVEVYPDMKIYIGTATRGHPNWQYEASFTSVESPSSDFTPFGLDLLLLKLVKKVRFEGLMFSEDGASSSAFTYSFESVKVLQEEEDFIPQSEALVRFEMGSPFKLFPTDKLRLLGFPASGWYSLSVLTTYFTSMSFDYPTNRRGAWCNVNTQLPSGGSGGAAVNAKGQLVGISTQTKGELTNIRSITEAFPLILKAKREVDKEQAREREKKRKRILSPHSLSDCMLTQKLSLSKLFPLVE